MVRTAALPAALVLAASFAFAQQGEPARQGGGAGLTFNFGGVLNALRNAANKNTSGQPPVLQKRADAVGTPSGGNYTVNWVISYANTSTQTIANALVRDGPIATIIPGSLQQPAGWSLGVTNAMPLPANNYAQWTAASVAPHGVMTATFPPPLPSSMSLAGSGDGYQPIPYTRLSAPAGQRIYFMNHHATPGTVLFKCLDVISGVACAGWGLGKKLPAGDNSSNSSGTMVNTSEYTIDNGKIYYASQGPSGIGIGCYNLETDMECGLANFGPKTAGLHINGPWRVGNELYVADTDGALYCASLSGSLPPCVGGNYKISAAAIKIYVDKPGFDNYNLGGYLAGKVIANKVYITSIKSSTKYTNCFDSTTKLSCWTTNVPTVGSAPYSFSVGFDKYNVSNFLYYDVGGSAVAICTMRRSPAAQLCVDTNNGAAKSGLVTVLPGLVNFGAGLETFLAGKTYFINSRNQDDYGADAYCWNWATPGACTTAPLGLIAKGPISPDNYGSNSDAEGCIWIYGDKNRLWHFNSNNIDATTGLAKPCGGGAKFIKVFEPLQYCSGPKPFRWTSVEVKGAPLANYSKFIVKVLNSSNNVLFTKDLKATGQLQADITGIDAQTIGMPLKIEIEYTPNPGMGASDQPYLEVRYDAPAPEFCFQSTHTCQQGKITNTVEAQDPFDPNKSVKAQAEVAQPQSCGLPLCIACGTVNTPTCPPCGQAGQAPCPACDCVIPPPPPPPPFCVPGTPGWPLCLTCANPPCVGTPPPPPNPVCLTGDCAPKPPVSVGEEYKPPKVTCVRKAKVVEETKKPAASKPRLKPPVAAAPATPANVDAAPKPKPKPRPKPAVKKDAQDDDC